MSAGLSVELRVEQGGFTLDVAFTAQAGEVVAVLGPNGAGKTTLLRALAGLIAPTDARVELGGRWIHDLPARARRVGVVFQDYRLFPHLSALDNVAFGLRSTGTSRVVARDLATASLDRMGLANYAKHKPAQLSGGQAQRVALARALCTEPDLLLLDEPLAALDATARPEVRQQLQITIKEFGGVTILVTHDPLEALSLADRLIILEDGRITQDAAATEIARRPASAYAAALVGLNLFRGIARGGRLVLADGGELFLADHELAGPALAVARPSSVLIEREAPSGTSARNVLPGHVTSVEALGERARLSISSMPPMLADITTDALAELKLGVGDRVWVSLKATELTCYADRA